MAKRHGDRHILYENTFRLHVENAGNIHLVPTFDFLAPALLGGPSGIMISNIVVSLFGAAYNWPLGAAISLGMLVLVVSLLFVSERLEKKWSFS